MVSYQTIVPVTRHGIEVSDARTTTPRRSHRHPRRVIRRLSAAIVRYQRSANRRIRPQQGADAVQTLADLPDGFQE